MKKFIFLLSLLCFSMLLSCTKQLPIGEPESDLKPVSTFVTEEMAIVEVEEFLKHFEAQTKSGKRTISNIYSSGGTSMTRSDSVSSNEEPFVYIVNFANNEGFAIVSGDNRMSPILAIVDKGNLEQGDIIEDPGVIAMLGNIDVDYRMTVGLPVINPNGTLDYPLGMTEDGTYVYPGSNNGGNTVIQDGFITIGDNRPPVITYEYTGWENYTTRGNLVGCEWGQSRSPYNLYTYTADGRKAPAGCVATAVSQIMYYWGKDFTMDGYDFDWDIMRLHKSKNEPYEEAYEMIGELFLKLGQPNNLNMDYQVDGSGAYSDDVPRTFVNCGYTNGGYNEDYNYDRLYNIISSRPAYISGKSKKIDHKFLGITVSTSYSGGHAWVVDQILTRTRKKYTYSDGVKISTTTQYEHLVHCNWGWDGSCNGYYYSSQFDTNEGPVTRAGETGSQRDYYYQYLLKMNVNIIAD